MDYLIVNCSKEFRGVKLVSNIDLIATYLRGKTRQMIEMRTAGTRYGSCSSRNIGINHYYPYGLSIAGLGGNYDDYKNKYTSAPLHLQCCGT